MTAITYDSLGRAAIRLPVAVFWPATFLVVAWIAVRHSDSLPGVVWDLVGYLPYAVSLIGAIIGWHFSRSRLVFSLIAVAVGHWMMTGPAAHPRPGSSGEIGYMAFALLFPIGLLVLSLLKERGLLTRHGLMRAALFGAVSVAVLAIAAADHWLVQEIALEVQRTTVGWLSVGLIPNAWIPKTAIPEVAILAFIAVGAYFIMRLVVLGNPPLESGALGGLIGGGMALHFAGDSQAVAVFFSAAAGSMLLAAIQDGYRLAFVDELTGLPARRALTMETLKLGHRYAIAMLDVDHFKKFNDTYGHDIGDQVLRMVAARLDRVAGGGKPFRYGGEEFTIVFSGKTADEAMPPLDALRQSIEDSGFTIRGKNRPKTKERKKKTGGGKRVSVTISIGVSERSEKHPTPETVIKAADQALYRAKKGGRNRVSR